MLWLSVYIQRYLYQVPFYFFYTCGQNNVTVTFDQSGHRLGPGSPCMGKKGRKTGSNNQLPKSKEKASSSVLLARKSRILNEGTWNRLSKTLHCFLRLFFSYFCVVLAEQWNHDVTASSKTGRLPNR